MIFSSSDPKDKSFKNELKGDQWRSKGNAKKALDAYRKALKDDDSRVSLYDKLLSLLDENKGEWSEEEFADSVYFTMKRQELLDPTFKRIHARAEPDFVEVTQLIKKMFTANEQAIETECVEKIASYGETAVYPLLDFLLTFKNLGKKAAKKTS
jgi:hypothetical protein